MNDELTDEDKAAIYQISLSNTGRCVKNDEGYLWTISVGYKGRRFRVELQCDASHARISHTITEEDQ